MTGRPRVSVLMPVYNAAAYVAEAVTSVLAQTFDDFELLAVDDGSTDGSLRVLRSLHDGRLRVIARPHAGVVATMNAALTMVSAELIARADADDLCRLDRLERQVAFMTTAADVAVVGGSLRRGAGVLTYPSDTMRIRWLMLYRSPFANPTLMFRREAALAVGGYPPDHHYVDDYPFVSRLVARYRGANLPEVLVEQRINPDGISGRHGVVQRAEGDRVRRQNLNALVADGDAAADLLYLLAGGPRRPAFRPAQVRRSLDQLGGAFRAHWGLDETAWTALAPWVAREIFECALAHGVGAPGVLLRMAAWAIRLDPGLLRRAATVKGLAKHLVLARVRP